MAKWGQMQWKSSKMSKNDENFQKIFQKFLCYIQKSFKNLYTKTVYRLQSDLTKTCWHIVKIF